MEVDGTTCLWWISWSSGTFSTSISSRGCTSTPSSPLRVDLLFSFRTKAPTSTAAFVSAASPNETVPVQEMCHENLKTPYSWNEYRELAFKRGDGLLPAADGPDDID